MGSVAALGLTLTAHFWQEIIRLHYSYETFFRKPFLKNKQKNTREGKQMPCEQCHNKVTPFRQKSNGHVPEMAFIE